MGIFDSLKRAAENAMKKEASKAVNNAVNNAAKTVGKGKNRSETFTFASLPANVSELQALPEASLDSAFKTTALTLVALCRYEHNPDEAIEMLNFLKGPAEVSTYEKQFIRERLVGKMYKPRSYFAGATPENGYTPTVPYTITVSETPYSFDDENWATLYVTSGGADNPRPVKLRKKPSTGQWFLNDIQCLADIRVPVEEDPWA
ncbi:MAG: hypothetical protein IJ046_01205 [Clostridia bacterium]|nr:hypothetical protein [Clostridia bacterium]